MNTLALETTQRLQRYTTEIQQFEERFGMDAATFYQRFQAGKLGDDIDFFEWAGLYELKLDLLAKIHKP